MFYTCFLVWIESQQSDQTVFLVESVMAEERNKRANNNYKSERGEGNKKIVHSIVVNVNRSQPRHQDTHSSQ